MTNHTMTFQLPFHLFTLILQQQNKVASCILLIFQFFNLFLVFQGLKPLAANKQGILIVAQMIPLLVEKFGADRMSYVLFGSSQILFTVGFIFANDNKMNPIETSLLRGIASVILNYSMARYYDMTLDYKYDVTFINLLKRNFIMVLHGLAMGTAQFYLPLPIVHTISFFAPIFIFIIDFFQNGVRINRTQFYCLMSGVLGIVCTINEKLVSKIVDKDYAIQTEFKNYISLDPMKFSLYGLALIGVMFIWAYGLLRVRTFYKNTHVHVNFHLGILFIIMSGFLYPIRVTKPSPLPTLFKGLFFSGFPLAFAQTVFGAGLAMNKKTGQVVILTGIPVLLGYLISYFRYGQTIKVIEIMGSMMILIGLLGVTNCGDEPKEEAPSQARLTETKSQVRLTSTKILGDPSNNPTQIMNNVLRLNMS